jgi:hypothetical protein
MSVFCLTKHHIISWLGMKDSNTLVKSTDYRKTKL